MTDADGQDVTASLEDYLEAILRLGEEKGRARVVDIARTLGVGKPSVTAALKTLAEKKLVNYTPYRAATLTPPGREVAGSVRKKHVELQAFLTGILGMDDTVAEEEACRLEHAVSEELMDRLRVFRNNAGKVLHNE